jgi:hypothetical protein
MRGGIRVENKNLVAMFILIAWICVGARGYAYYADQPVLYESIPLGKEIMPTGYASILDIDRGAVSGPSMIYSWDGVNYTTRGPWRACWPAHVTWTSFEEHVWQRNSNGGALFRYYATRSGGLITYIGTIKGDRVVYYEQYRENFRYFYDGTCAINGEEACITYNFSPVKYIVSIIIFPIIGAFLLFVAIAMILAFLEAGISIKNKISRVP